MITYVARERSRAIYCSRMKWGYLYVLGRRRVCRRLAFGYLWIKHQLISYQALFPSNTFNILWLDYQSVFNGIITKSMYQKRCTFKCIKPNKLPNQRISYHIRKMRDYHIKAWPRSWYYKMESNRQLKAVIKQCVNFQFPLVFFLRISEVSPEFN